MYDFIVTRLVAHWIEIYCVYAHNHQQFLHNVSQASIQLPSDLTMHFEFTRIEMKKRKTSLSASHQTQLNNEQMQFHANSLLCTLLADAITVKEIRFDLDVKWKEIRDCCDVVGLHDIIFCILKVNFDVS